MSARSMRISYELSWTFIILVKRKKLTDTHVGLSLEHGKNCVLMTTKILVKLCAMLKELKLRTDVHKLK